MEVVGALASLVQLVDLALSVAKTSQELYKSYQEAPATSKTVENQRVLLQSVLEGYTHLRPRLDFDGSNSSALPSDSRQMVANALSQVSEALQKLRTALDYREEGNTKTSRIRWALSKRKAVKEAQSQLEKSKSTLMISLQLLSIHLSVLHQSSIELHQSSIEEDIGALKRHVNESSNIIRLLHQPGRRRTTELRDDFTESPASTSVSTRYQSQLSIDCPHHGSTEDQLDSKTQIAVDPAAMGSRIPRTKLLEVLAPDHGISGFWSSVSGSNKTTYSLSLRAKLPWWLGNRILILEWKIRQLLSSWSNLTILQHISLSGYVSKDSLIAQACFKNDEVMVRKLFSEGKATPNDIISDCNLRDMFPLFPNPDGTMGEITVLAAAIRSGSLSLLKYVIDIGANVNLSFGHDHMSPLQLAASCGNLEMMRLLITRDALLDHVDLDNFGVFGYIGFWAALRFKEDVINNEHFSTTRSVHSFIQALHVYGYCFDSIHNVEADCNDFLAFFDAESVAFLLQQGCIPINDQDPNACTVRDAATIKNAELLKYLLPLSTEAQINEALLSAVDGHSNSFFDHPFDIGDPIERRMAEIDGTCVKLLLSHGANTECRDRNGRTPLYWASKKNAADCVQIFLEHGANIGAKAEYDDTPLHIACCHNSIDCVKLLLEHGANIGAKDEYGDTPLHIASWHNSIDCVKLLLERGSNPHATGYMGWTPLQRFINATIYRPLQPSTIWNEILSCLLRYDADPMLPIPYFGRRFLLQDSGVELKAMDRIEDCLIHRNGMEERAALYHMCLHDIYPEIIVDTNGTVYWDAKEELEGLAYGTCWYLAKSDEEDEDWYLSTIGA